MKIYFDFRDWWIGYYRGDRHHYVCLLPTVVIRWRRKNKKVITNYKIEPGVFAGIPILVDKNLPPNTAYMINKKPFDFTGQQILNEREVLQNYLTINKSAIRKIKEMESWKWNNPA